MIWLIWLILNPSLVSAHVRLAEVPSSTSTWRSVPPYPQLQWQPRNQTTSKPANNIMHLDQVTKRQYCEAEEFPHNYQTKATNGSIIWWRHRNQFKRTKIGEYASMRDLCLDAHGLPLRRQCSEVNATATWEQLTNVTCLEGNQLSESLHQLHEELLGELPEKPVSLTKLRSILTQAHGQLAPVDVYSTAQIFDLLVAQPQKSPAVSVDLVGICQQIMSSDKQILKKSAEVNATNSLLSRFEDYLDALPQQLVPSERCGHSSGGVANNSVDVNILDYAHIGVQALMSSNLSVFYVNPSCSNITGIAIYSSSGRDRLPTAYSYWYRFLYANESLEVLRRDRDLETATYLPEQLLLHVLDSGYSYLVLKVYAHDALFVETSKQQRWRPRSKVLSITIPGMETNILPEAVPFLLRKPHSNLKGGCGYWNYETWLDQGITTCQDKQENSDIVLCQAQHLTQFSFLIGASYAQQHSKDLQLDAHEQLLDTVTIVGCGLSLFGLLGIFVTAVVARKWREQASTKVLLHLCLALAVQLLLFGFLSQADWMEQLALDRNWNLCVISGAALQYSVLVIFSWMLIIAILQFQRYVTVIGVARPNHYILISAVAAWSLPTMPTLLVVFLDEKSYKPSQYQLETHTALCYPSGYGLALGVVLPIALVTVANSFMMICIIYSIYRALNPRRQLIVQQLRLSVLLFFLLGLTWIFGLCSYLQLGIIFSYLFCLTATLQGFVLFVYFVVFNAMNRRAWLNFICPSRVKVDAPKRTTELQSTTTSSTNASRRSETSN